MRYEAKVLDPSGQLTVSIVDATSQDEAMELASRSGQVMSLKRKFGFVIHRMEKADRNTFLVRMSAMLQSRVGTSESLKIMHSAFTGEIKRVSGKILSMVEQGDDLPKAMQRIGEPDFPRTLLALIEAGSRAGNTAQALRDAAKFETELARVKKSASKGLFAAIAGYVIAIATSLVSVFWLGPEIMKSDLIKAAGDVDLSVYNMMGKVIGYGMLGLAGLSIGFFAFSFIGRQVAPGFTDKFISKVPFFRELILSQNSFVTLYGLGLLVEAGVRMEEALKLSAESAPKGLLKEDLTAAYAAVRNGTPWPNAVTSFHPTDRASLLCAVDRGQIAKTLGILAEQYRDIYASCVTNFSLGLTLVTVLCLALSGLVLFGQGIMPFLVAMSKMAAM